jgi:hypothetical protein
MTTFFQPAHYPVGGGQAKGASTREQNSMNMRHKMHRAQQIGFAGAWGTATLVDTAYSTIRGQQYGASCDRVQVLSVADLNTRNVTQK